MGAEFLDNLLATNRQKYPATFAQFKMERLCDYSLGEKILNDNLERQRLIVLIPPLCISSNCPPPLQVDLAIELVEELKTFLQTDYSFPNTRPIELHTHFLKTPLHDQDLEALHQLLAPLPVLVIYTTITDCRIYTHMAWWVTPTPYAEYLSLASWEWEEIVATLVETGMKENHSLRLVRHAVLRTYQFLLVIFSEWYNSFLHQDTYLSVLQTIAPLRELSILEIDLSLIRQEGLQRHNLILKERQSQRDHKRQKLLELGQRWQLYGQFTPHPGMIYGLKFYPQHNWLIVAGSAGLLKVFSLSTKKEVLALNGHDGDVLSLIASPNHKSFATLGSNGQVKLWDLGALSEIATWELGVIGNCLSFSRDNRFLACGSQDGYIFVWDLWTEKLFCEFADHQQPIYTLMFSADSSFLLTGGQDGYIKIWNYAKGKLDNYFAAHPQGVFRMAFSPNGDYLVSGVRNGGLTLWHSQNYGVIASLIAHEKCVTAIAFNRVGDMLASGGLDGRVLLWDLHSQQKFAELTHDNHPILCLDFDTNQRLAAGSSWQNNLRIWHYLESNPHMTVPPPSGI